MVSGGGAKLTLGENLKVISTASFAVAVNAATLIVDGAFINSASSSVLVYNGSSGGRIILEDNINTTVHGIRTGTTTTPINHGYIEIKNGLMFNNFVVQDLDNNLGWAKTYLTITGGYFTGLSLNSDGTTRYDGDIYDIKPAYITNNYYTETQNLRRVYPYANSHWDIEGDVQTEKYEIHVDTPEYSGATPSKEKTAKFSYDFVGWSLTQGESAELIENFSVIHEHTTFYAMFESRVNKYTFSYLANGETITSELYYGDEIIPPEAPQKIGHTFDAWQLDGENFDFKWDSITEDIELVAKYNVNNYTLTFVPNNGEETTFVTQNYDSEITAPVLERIGHTFVHWLYNGSEYTVDKMPAEDITIYALWRVDYIETDLEQTEKTNTKLSYKSQENYEFALADLFNNLICGWSESAVFENLTADTSYKLLVRLKGDGEYILPSLPSEELVAVYSDSEYFIILLTNYYQNKLDNNEYLPGELSVMDDILTNAEQEINDAESLGEIMFIYDITIIQFDNVMTKSQIELADKKADARKELENYFAEITEPSDMISDMISDIFNQAIAEINAAEIIAELDSIVETAKGALDLQLDREYAESQLNAYLDGIPSKKVQDVIDNAINSMTNDSAVEDIIASAIVGIDIQLAVEKTEGQLNTYVTVPSQAVQSIIDNAISSIDVSNYGSVDSIIAVAKSAIDIQLDREEATKELLSYYNTLKADNDYSEKNKAELDKSYASGFHPLSRQQPMLKYCRLLKMQNDS